MTKKSARPTTPRTDDADPAWTIITDRWSPSVCTITVGQVHVKAVEDIMGGYSLSFGPSERGSALHFRASFLGTAAAMRARAVYLARIIDAGIRAVAQEGAVR